MSLRIFHVLFIAVSVLLSLFVIAWSIRNYQLTGRVSSLVLGAIFLVAGVVMVEYGRRFFGKLKELS